MKRKIIFSVFVALLLIMLCADIAFADSELIHNDGTTVVYQQLDYLRLRTSKGILLSELKTESSIDTHTETTTETITVVHEEPQVQQTTNEIDLCLILDTSSSMSPTSLSNPDKVNRIGMLRDAVKNIVNSVNGNLSIIQFSNSTSIIAEFNDQQSKNDICLKIDKLTAFGSTKTDSAVKKAENEWKESGQYKSTNKKYTVLITDGMPNSIPLARKAINDFKTTFTSNENECDIKFLTLLIGFNEVSQTAKDIFRRRWNEGD